MTVGAAIVCLIVVASRQLLPWISANRAGLIEDDGYFYAQIAYTAAQTGIFSFDGVDTTSGFHLLWGAILRVVSTLLLLTTEDKAWHLTSHLVAYLAVLVGIIRIGARTFSERLLFAGLLLLSSFLMETAALSLVLLAIARLTALRAANSKEVEPIVLGSLAVCVPLMRIDASIIVLVWALLIPSARRLAPALLAGLAMGVLIHFAVMWSTFGVPFSVSSVLKSSSVGESLRLFSSLKKIGLAARFCVFLVLIFCCLAGWRGLKDSQDKRRVLALALGACSFVLPHLVLSDIRSWYFLPGYVILAYCLSEIRVLPRVAPRVI